jgi:hypothetical protein
MNILTNENNILQMRLYEAGQVNQTNEIRWREAGSHMEELGRLREAVNFYQRALTKQQGATEYEKKQHARTTQSLTHESQCHQVTAQSLEHERTQVRDFIGFLDSLELPKTKSTTETSVGALWLEKNDMKVDLERQAARTKYLEQALDQAQEELEHKQLLVKELSCKYEREPEVLTSPTGVDENQNMKAETMLLESSGDEKPNTLLGESSEEEKGDTMLLESSGEEKASILKSFGKRQQRKRRHS